MSDNKFEKQVQQKMDELKITPSDGTWEKIEAGFRLQRRRRFSIWLPALLLLVAGGSYFVYQALDDRPGSFTGSAGPHQITDRVDEAVEGPTGLATVPSFGDQGRPGALDKTTKDQFNNEARETNAAPPLTTGLLTERKALQDDNKKKDPRFGDKLSVPDAKAISSAAGKDTYGYAKPILSAPLTGAPAPRGSLPDQQDNERNKDLASISEQTLPDELPRLQLEQDDTKIAGEELTGKDKKAIAAIPLKDIVNAPAENDEKQAPAVAVNKKKHANRNWQWGITASAGMAFVSEGNGLDFRQSIVEDLSMSSTSLVGPSFAPSPPSTVPGPSFTPSTPSEIRPGLAFAAGGVVKRKFSDRISVSAGLSYAQYNTHTLVGERVDRNQIVNSGAMGYQNVGSYFLNTNTHDYSNRYHFIDLPLTMYVKINKSEKTPFYLNAGGYLSRLIASNSLHFDGANAVYYKNNDFLNKMQAGASAGFSMVIFNQGSMPLWIGPSLRYNFSPLLKKSASTDKRLVMPSVDIKLFFNK